MASIWGEVHISSFFFLHMVHTHRSPELGAIYTMDHGH